MFRKYIMYVQLNGSGIELQRAIARKMHDPNKDYSGTAWHRYLKDIGIYKELYGERRHQFITIALPNDYKLEHIKKYAKSPHKWAKGGLMSVEYYSSNGENLHIHMLKEDVYSKTKIIRDLARRFKVKSNFIDVRTSTSVADFNNRKNYICGRKSTTEKLEHVEKDREWRKENEIPDIFNL